MRPEDHVMTAMEKIFCCSQFSGGGAYNMLHRGGGLGHGEAPGLDRRQRKRKGDEVYYGFLGKKQAR